MDSLIFSLNATVPVFAVIFISYLLKKRGFFPEAFTTAADKIVFKVFLPVMLFQDIAAGRIVENFDLKFFLFCSLSTTVYFLGIWAFAELFLKDKFMVGAFTQASFRGSMAVMGVAFIQNIYGNAGLAPLMIVAAVPLYNVYSVLVLTVRGQHPQNGRRFAWDIVKGILTNPLILGILAGLPFSLLEIEFPAAVSKTIGFFAAPATPLALMLIGAEFEGAKALQKVKPTLVASFIKLIALPAIFLPAAYLMGFRNQELVSILIMTGAPSTVTCYIMAKNMGGDAVLSSSIIVLTTALSALTMTAALYVMRCMGIV